MARDSIISVYQDYQMHPGFYRLRSLGAPFVAGGVNLDAKVLFVGDFPIVEDVANILAATDFPIDQVYITALVKYAAPPPAHPAEIRDSRPFLRREMKFLDPSVICPLGPHALGSFITKAPAFNVARGRTFYTRAGTPVVPVMYAADFQTALQHLTTEEFVRRG